VSVPLSVLQSIVQVVRDIRMSFQHPQSQVRPAKNLSSGSHVVSVDNDHVCFSLFFFLQQMIEKLSRIPYPTVPGPPPSELLPIINHFCQLEGDVMLHAFTTRSKVQLLDSAP
jgi:hypothetical protein